MVGEIVINGIRMEDGDREILEGCKTTEETKEFWLVYHYSKHIRGGDGREVYEGGYVNVNDNMKVNKKKIHKKVGVKGGENFAQKKKRGKVPCEQGNCHKTFENRWNMKRHLEAKLFNHDCDFCEKSLKGSRNLMTHMKTKHKEHMKQLECDKCDAKFPGEKSLSMHMKMHDPNYGKFECENCILFFTQKHSMERHRRNFHK